MSDVPVIPNIDPAVSVWLAFIAPNLWDGTNAKAPLTNVDVNTAAYLAQDFTPKCLSVNQQAEAQALYTAHLLVLRKNVLAGTGPGGESAQGPLSMEKEGDLQRIWALSQAAQNGEGGTGFYDRWNALWLRCRPLKIGAILTGSVRIVPQRIDLVNNPEFYVWGRWPFI